MCQYGVVNSTYSTQKLRNHVFIVIAIRTVIQSIVRLRMNEYLNAMLLPGNIFVVGWGGGGGGKPLAIGSSTNYGAG